MIAKHGEPAPRLCNKDPFALKSMVELSNMFPNAKFLLMVRDGRAVIHSIISRKVRYLNCTLIYVVCFKDTEVLAICLYVCPSARNIFLHSNKSRVIIFGTDE